MSAPSTRPRLVSLAAGWLAFAIYVATAAPTAFWLDSSELAAGAFELGIPHPPGHPLFVLLGKLATLVPIGSIAFRVHVLCGALIAAGVALAVRLALRLWPRGAGWPVLPVAIALTASTPFWFHGVRAEVYPLHLVLAAAIVLLAIRASERGRAGDVALLGLATGLALANHHYLTALMAPGIMVLLLRSGAGRRALWRGWAGATAGLLAGLATYALLPLRAGALTTVRWGEAGSPGGLAWVLTAEAFQKTAGRVAEVDAAGASRHLAELIGDQIGWILPGLALIGLLLMGLRRAGLALGFVLLVAGNLASQIIFDFDPTNPDVAGYFLLSVWLIGVLAVGALAAAVDLASRYSAPTRLLAQAAAVTVPLLGAWTVLPGALERCDLSSQRDTDVFAGATLDMAPTDAVVVTAYFETIFNLWYRDAAGCERPDVAVVHRLFRTYPGYDAYLDARYPWLEGMLDVDWRTGQLDPDWLHAQSAERAVLLEADPTLPSWIGPRALPAGLQLRLSPIALPSGRFPQELIDADRRFWLDLYRRVDERQRETAGNLLWAQVNQMTVFGTQGREAAARERFDRAWEIAPGDPDLIDLADEAGVPRLGD